MAKKILTVDDSASIRQMVSFTLSQAGYEIMEAVDGRDALTKLGGISVDMMITDLTMPNLDGVELIRQVRTQPQHKFIPILMLTTESLEEKKQQGKAAGATGWIVKPFNATQLTDLVKKLLR